MKKRPPKILTRLAGFASAKAIGGWMGTLDYRAVFYDETANPLESGQGQNIFCFWHEYILFPIHLCGHHDIAMLLSQHRDADILEQAAYFLGFDTVRGSRKRGAVEAIRTLLRKGRQQHLTITPDGPRGPRRRMEPGPIYLASRLGIPLVLSGFGYDRPWRMNSWDRFALPRPYSRARAVVSPRVHVPADLDREGIEYYRHRAETLLNRLTCEAEAWAHEGTRKVEERIVYRKTKELRQPQDENPQTREQVDFERKSPAHSPQEKRQAA